MPVTPAAPTQLKRRIGLPLLIFYGVGVMIGAGIYVLTGAAAGAAGQWAPLAFLIAGLVAAPTALSYAELSARIPEAAGEAAYVELGLGSHRLGVLVGLGIVVAGTISSAAVLRGGSGYAAPLLGVPPEPLIVAVGLALTAIALIGAVESLAFAALITIAEVTGLALVIWAGFAADPVPGWGAPGAPDWNGIGVAVALAFFAFIGFEDIVNMAEEVREPTRTLPRAILWSLAITAILYALVSLAAVRAVPPEQLAASDRPLALVWEAATGRPAVFLGAIAAFAALNGVLAQILMAARVLFGLGRRSPFLRVFYIAHPRFGTPARATLLLGLIATLAALALPVARLAEATTLVLLVVFALVNAALIALHIRAPRSPFRVPRFVPWAGLAASLVTLGSTLATG